MKTSLQSFLTDLYAIDPSLKTHEAEIIPLVEKLLASDPAQEPDTEFVKRLRMELQDRGTALSGSPASSGWQKWLFAAGGAVTAAVIIPVAFIAYQQNGAQKFTASDDTPLFTYNISNTGKEAFGPLTSMTEGQSAMNGRGGGVGVAATPSQAPMADGATNEMMIAAPDAKMIAPYPMFRYEYVYNGEIKDLKPTVSVYKRDPSAASIPLSAIGSSLNLGSIDIGSFGNMNLDSVTFSQNKPYGYQITANLRDSSVYLDAQWDQWPMSRCQTDACWQAERVKLSDVPSEDDLLEIANAFVQDHNIDVTHYGTPSVDMLWKRDYDRAPDKSQAWIPDQIRVLYPLVIEDTNVADQGGAPFGISVSVHVKLRKVMNVYGIMSRNYLKSQYDGVTDAQQIKDYLGNVDNYGWMPEVGSDVKTATVTLGEPVLGYSVYYKYDQLVTDELLVPSLIFPVTEVKGGDQYFYRNTVVVPLAAEMLKEQMNQGGGGRPMPLDGVKAM
jgi:hypothetical protein